MPLTQNITIQLPDVAISDDSRPGECIVCGTEDHVWEVTEMCGVCTLGTAEVVGDPLWFTR